MKSSRHRSLIVLASALLFSASALAQYIWLDENGKKQISDQPPPASVPQSKILKVPNKTKENQFSSSSNEVKTPPSENLAEKEAAYKKRHDELAAKEKKNAEEAKAAADKSEHCKRMQAYKQNLNSGQRILQTDANGTRSYMTDEQRAQELNQLNQNMGDCNSQ